MRHALATRATRYSNAAVTVGHLALKRAIRHAEANDLVSRNVAALADTPKGQDGRPLKSLTLKQAVAVITGARTLPVMELRLGLMHAYIVLSLLAGIRTEGTRALRWAHVDLDGDPATLPPYRRILPRGDRCAGAARPRPSGPAAPSPSPAWPSTRSATGRTARPASDSRPGEGWQETGLVFTTHLGAALDAGTSGRCSNGFAPRPESGTQTGLASV